jgi:hypothetical protein
MPSFRGIDYPLKKATLDGARNSARLKKERGKQNRSVSLVRSLAR